MENQITINLKVDGKDCTFQTTHAQINEFCLMMIEPNFDAIFCSNHIPHFALAGHRFIENNSFTNHALITVNSMSKGLYRAYLIAIANHKIIESKFEEILQDYTNVISNLSYDIEKLNSELRDCKKQYKNNKMVQKYYQNQKTEIDKQKDILREVAFNKKSLIIKFALAECYPVIHVREDTCSNYTISNAIENYFWRMVEKKSKELIKTDRLLIKK